MRDSKIKKSQAPDQERALMDTLLGSDDELLSDDCSDEFLQALDIDPSRLTAEFISRLENESHDLPPDSVERKRAQAALRSIRGQIEPARAPASRIHAKQPGANAKSGYWTNRSVLTFAGGNPPVERMTQEAKKAIREFTDAGNVVPPLDPFALAEFRNI